MLLFASPAFAVMEDYPSVKLQGLDKSVGRTVTFEAKVGDTIQYGPLFVKIHACRKAPPIEKPESAAFLQIWEVPPGEKKSQWVFSGWMFASSPALSAMDHPVYDVWVIECTGRDDLIEKIPEDDVAKAADEAPADPVIDSEAEDQTQQQPAPGAQTPSGDAATAPQETPVTQSRPEEYTPAVQEPSSQEPALQTPAPQDDAGFTAYDLMKQKNAPDSVQSDKNPTNSGASVPQTPIY